MKLYFKLLLIYMITKCQQEIWYTYSSTKHWIAFERKGMIYSSLKPNLYLLLTFLCE